MGNANLDLGVKITRVGEENNFCVEISLRDGDYLEFIDQFNEIRKAVEQDLGYLDEKQGEDNA
jgi:hypothetical protein